MTAHNDQHLQTSTTSSACGHDHGHSEHGHDHHHHGHTCGHDHETPGQATLEASRLEGLVLHVPAMDCPIEESEIRKVLNDVTEIRRLQFDLSARLIAVDAPESVWADVQSRIQGAGFESRQLVDTAALAQSARYQRRMTIQLVVALVVALSAELIHLILAPESKPWTLAGMGLAAVAIGLSGFSVLKKGWQALREFRLNINALMTVAVIGAFLIGDWPEAAMVMALYSIAELIEARAISRARNAVKSLLDLAPVTAQIQNSQGVWVETPVQQVAVNAIVRVRPGERFAFDGEILKGHSSADQSAITGESVPVEKSPGDKVFAGTVNQQAELEYIVQAQADDTVLANIIHVVEQAQATKAPIQRFVDRFAAVYTPLVFLLAIVVAIGSPLFLGADWLNSLYKGLVLLVIGCPCALVISTPVTIVSGLTTSARLGVLIKGGAYLELARRLQWLALDKTGTITRGEPELVEHLVFAPTYTATQVHIWAHALASRSDHPVSQAMARGIQSIEPALLNGVVDLEIDQFEALAGLGVQGLIESTFYRMGSHRWIHAFGLCTEQIDQSLASLERQGYTVTVLATEEVILGAFAVADTVRETSKQAIAQLREQGIQVVMLTGDNALTAAHIAAQVGIEDVRADLLPVDKLKVIEEFVQNGVTVGMVGDGINDSPALASADIGFAMGQAGSDIAVEAADVVIMNDDLRRIVRTVKLSHRVHRVLWQNIALALGIKAVFFVLALMDQATMWMAVFADMGASLLVVFNGLRLIRTSREDREEIASE